MLKVKTHFKSKTMDVVNAVNMIMLFWTFTSVCEASDDSCTFISCADVTGTVHEELILTCSISCNKEVDQCCIESYKFKDSRDENATVISKKEFLNETCEREINATCVYFPSAKMTAKFSFFLQAKCETKTTEFIVNITETISGDAVKKGEAKLTTSEVTVTVGAIIVFIVIMLIIYRKCNTTNPCRI